MAAVPTNVPEAERLRAEALRAMWLQDPLGREPPERMAPRAFRPVLQDQEAYADILADMNYAQFLMADNRLLAPEGDERQDPQEPGEAFYEELLSRPVQHKILTLPAFNLGKRFEPKMMFRATWEEMATEIKTMYLTESTGEVQAWLKHKAEEQQTAIKLEQEEGDNVKSEKHKEGPRWARAVAPARARARAIARIALRPRHTLLGAWVRQAHKEEQELNEQKRVPKVDHVAVQARQAQAQVQQVNAAASKERVQVLQMKATAVEEPRKQATAAPPRSLQPRILQPLQLQPLQSGQWQPSRWLHAQAMPPAQAMPAWVNQPRVVSVAAPRRVASPPVVHGRAVLRPVLLGCPCVGAKLMTTRQHG